METDQPTVDLHTVSAYRRAAFDGVRTPRASHGRTASPVVETDQPTVDLGAKTGASPTASQRGTCAGRAGPNTDCTSYRSLPHSDRRPAPDGVRSPHASHGRTASPVVETDQPTVDLGVKTGASPTASQQGACAGRVGPNTDCISYSIPPHTVSHGRTTSPVMETDQHTVDEKERRSITVSQTYYNSVHDQFPSNSSNSEHHTVHRALQGARASPVLVPTPHQDNASHQRPRTSKSQHNKVSSYFNCKSKSDQSLNTIPPVGCTVTSTNNSTSLDTVVVSDASHPDRLNSSVGHGMDDHSHDLHSGHPRHE